MKKVVLFVNTLLCSHVIYATDYTKPINGAKTFNDGDRVIVSGPSGSAVSDSSTNSKGIHVNNNGAIEINATNSISTAVDLSNKVANDLGKGSSITANGNGFATGVNIRGTGTSLTATDLTLTAQSKSSNSSIGVNIQDGASVYLKGKSSITSTGTGVLIYASPNATASFTADQVSITATGTNATGVHTEKNTIVSLGDGSVIKTTGSNSTAIENFGGTFKGKNLTIINDNSGGSKGKAVDVRGLVDIDGGSITSTQSNGVSVFQQGTFNYKNGSITVNSDAAYGLLSQGKGSVANLTNTELTINGSSGYVIWATGGGGKVNADNTIINADNNYGLVANNQGNVTFTGNTVINAEKSGVAMVVDGLGSQVNTGSAGSKMTINGSLFSQNQGLIDMRMLSGSTFNGFVNTTDDSTTHLNMTDTLWNMTFNSFVTDLTATNTNINFISATNDYHTLNVKNLSGNNTTFAMKADLGGITTAPNAANERVGQAGVNGDLLAVTNSMGAGNYHLNVVNNGAAQTQGNEVLQVVSTPNNNTGNFSLTAPVEAGAYEYRLRQSTDSTGNKTGWELYSNGLTPHRTTTAEAATSFLNSNYLLSYVDTQTLLQRMGELRSGESKQQQGGFWLRGFGGKLNSFAGQQLSGFDMTYSGTQLGIDKQLDSQLGQVYVGMMAGMTHANPNYRDGDGTTKDYHMGLYATLMMDNGFYVDGVAKYTYMKNHFSVKDTQGNSVQGKGSSDGYSVSLEAGKRFHLNQANQSGFYVEPQAQITYGHQGGMSINASNGLKVDLGNYNYTLGRMSGIVGYQIAGANPVNLYVKTGYVREMDGSTSYKLNGQKSDYNARGGWWDNGVGVTAQFNKRHNIYADINYAKGSRFDQKQLNVGYRYSF